ncbi:hypothetical protein EW026_g2930 [Hermanssonia centrifuga]|uniref:Uncharacterized protein n=1 Tax=Hermanssonia centrifuga TaxID=98765 RepID=A0A4S4KLP2_9APHY|nr:hypothetical protein EW026_g2930 [Hermanssonia centrifuga]
MTQSKPKKRPARSTSASVRMATLSDSGRLRTKPSRLSDLRAERLQSERERAEQDQAFVSMAAQRLVESALEAGHSPHNMQDDFMLMDAAQDVGQWEDEEEDEDEDVQLDGLRDGEDWDNARGFTVKCGWRGTRRRHDQRTCRQHNRQMHRGWDLQSSDLASAYLEWKRGERSPPPSAECADGSSHGKETTCHTFEVSVVDVFDRIETRAVKQLAGEWANVSLLRVGLIGCSPHQPTIAISLRALELFHQIRRRQSSFSTQAMAKVFCALHDVTYFQTFRNQLSSAFDAYLNILQQV